MSLKSELRKEYNEKRKFIKDKDKKDNLICFNFLNSDLYKDANQIFCYSSLPNEINTISIINKALYDGKKIALPYCTDYNGNMEFYYINSCLDLKTGAFSILEPDISNCKKAFDFKNSVCIVPAFSFDKFGFRLGYGKGYYDRFLKNFTNKTVGLCYNDFLSNKLPSDKYDIAVQFIITEDKLITI